MVLAGAIVLALLTATWLGRTWRSPPVSLVAVVVVLPYLYAAVGVGLCGLWLLAPDRRGPPALIVALVTAAAAIWGGALASWPDAPSGEALRALSWNVRRLWGGPGDGGEPTGCVASTIGRLEPDLLTLQEVSRLDVENLESLLGMSCVHTDYFGTGDPEDGGLAACVREGRWRLRRGQTSRFVPDGDWHYVFAELESDRGRINVMSVHLQPYRLKAGGLGRADGVAVRQGNQSAELLRRVGALQDPTIIAGDFNSTRDAALHVALRDPLNDAFERAGSGFGPTFYLFDLLPIRIDYIYTTPDVRVTGAEVVLADCSDHRPVLADLAVPP